MENRFFRNGREPIKGDSIQVPGVPHKHPVEAWIPVDRHVAKRTIVLAQTTYPHRCLPVDQRQEQVSLRAPTNGHLEMRHG